MHEDELAIHNLVARYADAVCRRDEEAWGATWAEDGLWQLPNAPATRGREAIVQLWVGAMSQFPWVVQLIYNGTVDVDGDAATGRFYLCEHLKLADDSVMFNIGVYHDKYTRTDDGWKFTERHYAVLYNQTAEPTGATIPFPPAPF